MDFDLEIISEEGDRPDPLFDSIMNAMNSMKEATADKIYQKIQKEGVTNYSKPQVDRALESALKYGIFEVRNNRYRVRDDVLDDEDTVYWKFQRKRDQTPFRIQEDINEKQSGPKLDPERDNQRFRRPPTKLEECPHCGRNKRPEVQSTKKQTQKNNARRKKTRKDTRSKDRRQGPKRKPISKRQRHTNDPDEQCATKRRKTNTTYDKAQEKEGKISDTMRNDKSHDETSESSDSDAEKLVTSDDNLEYNNSSHTHDTGLQSAFSSECITTDLEALKSKRSNDSLRTESGSDKLSTGSDDQAQDRAAEEFFEQRPCTSKNTSGKIRNQYLHSSEMYRNQYERGQTDKSKGNPDWLGCSDEPQGAIIQSNNVLTIEPMDSLAFKNPEHTSYIS